MTGHHPTRPWAMGLLWSLLSIGGAGASAGPVSVPTQTEALGMLAAGQYAELDARFGAIQAAYKKRTMSDEDLRAAFRVFYDPDPALEAQYLAWVRHSPRSYVAHLATGIYYKKVGQDIRGDKFASETSQASLDGMDAAFQKSAAELRTSLALDDKPLLTLLHLMNIDQYEGDPVDARRLLDRSLVVDPKNFIIRNVYMLTLEARWGGSAAAMQAFLKECAHAGLSREHYRALEALVHEDQGWADEYGSGDYKAAIAEYEKASKLNPARNCLPCSPISRAAQLSLENKDYPEAIRQFNKVLALVPADVTARAGRGFARLQLGQVKDAVADIQFSADHGSAYGQDLLGKMYLMGTSIPKDRDQAIAWFRKAADQGYQPAIDLLPHVLDPAATPMLMPGGPHF